LLLLVAWFPAMSFISVNSLMLSNSVGSHLSTVVLLAGACGLDCHCRL